MTQVEHRNDHDLRTAILDELAWTPTVNADQIGVALTAGAVTLSGEVGTYPEKDAAVRAAMRVRGVTAVADEINVEHSWGTPDDATLAREVGLALARTAAVPPDAVTATVHNHAVTLSGTVGWQFQREAARRAVAALRGVGEVCNTVTLKPPFVVSAQEAAGTITAALLRNAQVDAERVHVSIVDSEVTLTGAVSSWAERRQAEHAAWSSPGVTDVDNRLTVTQ